MSTYTIWCLIEGEKTPFPVTAPSTIFILEFITKIKKMNCHFLDRVDVTDLCLHKLKNENAIDIMPAETLASRFEIEVSGKTLSELASELDGGYSVADVWPEQPPSNHLHVFVTLSSADNPTVVQQKQLDSFGSLQKYQSIFLKVNKWEEFDESDIDRNWIEESLHTDIPDFVRTFEKELVKKPRINPDMLSVLESFRITGSYFELSEPSIAEDESQEETRYADLMEVLHTVHLVLYDWEKFWQREPSYKPPFNEDLAKSILFYRISLYAEKRMDANWRGNDWPMHVVVQHGDIEPQEELSKFCPRSDFLISKSSLPRLLVGVNSMSTPGITWPKELIRMLTTGAFVVRFANLFVNAFRQERNFVLCVIFIWDDGAASRFTLFQQPTLNDDRVYYNEAALSLNDSSSRVEFARHLYNLLHAELDQDQAIDARSATSELYRRILDQRLMPVYTTKRREEQVRLDRNDNTNPGDRADRDNGGDRAQLRAHGFEAESDGSVDDKGGRWEKLVKRRDHILIVHRPMDPNKEFIAKKIREDSQELDILRLLETTPPRSDHVISLVDSFNGWAILPKMVTVRYYVDCAPDRHRSKVSRVCLGLIDGLAHLHRLCIAHRDINPANLVVDRNFCLKIIDFDIARRVEDKDEEVHGRCGTDGWMAPEVAMDLRHSPIKADRWACGRVILFLLDKFGKEDESLRAYALDLMAHNPKHRPSLLEWNSSALPDVGNVDRRKTSRPRLNSVETGGEYVKPLNVKKQRRDGD